jgi:plasmid stability protein
MQDLRSIASILTLFAVPLTALVVMACGVWREFRRRDDDIVVRLLGNYGAVPSTATLKMTELLGNAIDHDVLLRLEAQAKRNRRSVEEEHRAILDAALSGRVGIWSRTALALRKLTKR